MKALYVIWPDWLYIDKFIESGIDTLLVANQNLIPEDDDKHLHWGSYKDTISIMERYNGKVNLILVPLWNKFWEDLPEEQRIHTMGDIYSKTPCPTSKDFIDSRLDPALKLCKKYNAGLLWDPEHYGYGVEKGVLRWTYNDYSPKYECNCNSCVGDTKEEQWQYHNNYIREKLRNIKLNGQLSDRPWNFTKYPNDIWYFTESTYGPRSLYVTIKNKLLTWIRYNIITKIKFGYELKICPGLWIERFTAEDYLKKLEELLKSKVYDGYWIYSQMRTSRASWQRFKEWKKPNKTPFYTSYIDDTIDKSSDPEFFEKLKRLNKKYDYI